MKSLKRTAKSALIIGLATAVIGEAVYEGALNTKLNEKVSDAFGLNDKEIAKWYQSEYFTTRHDWFLSLNLPDNVIKGTEGNVHAYIIPAKNETEKWAVCVHGYQAAPDSVAHLAKTYYDLGYNVLVPSLRGYGEDTHKYCSMGWHDKTIVTDWIDYITAVHPDAKILVHGISMGGATVMLVTGEELPSTVKCAVADCGYTSVWAQFAHIFNDKVHIPCFPVLNTANIISKLRGNLDFRECSPKNAVRHSSTPTVFIHGEQDEFVPFSMLDEVYASCRAPKKYVSVENSIHAVSVMMEPEFYWNEILTFVNKYMD